jgi:hypothetical protein
MKFCPSWSRTSEATERPGIHRLDSGEYRHPIDAATVLVSGQTEGERSG